MTLIVQSSLLQKQSVAFLKMNQYSVYVLREDLIINICKKSNVIGLSVKLIQIYSSHLCFEIMFFVR